MTNRPLAIAQLLGRMTRIAQNAGYVHGLNPAQWDALRFFRQDRAGEFTACGLGQHQGITRASANETVRALERKGLLARETSRQDGRRQTVRLTPAGQRMLADDPLLDLADLIRRMPAHTIVRVNEAMAELHEYLVERGRGWDRLRIAAIQTGASGPGEPEGAVHR